MLKQNVDKVVMGCTHYPFVIPLIEEIVGDQVRVIDPAPAVARQTGRLLESYKLEADGEYGSVVFYSSGDPIKSAENISDLIGIKTIVGELQWVNGDLGRNS